MTQETQAPDWKDLQDAAGPYPLAAFDFVREGLDFTVQRLRESDEQSVREPDRHIDGRELSLGLRDFAIDQYGLLAADVLEQWRIHRTEDFGRIVFAMIDYGLMSKTSEDSLDDFRAVYDFHEAFDVSAVVEALSVESRRR